MDKPKPRHNLFSGLLCSVLIVFSWGSISLLLKLTRSFTDPVTFTWVRFTFAAVFMLLSQWGGGHLAQFGAMRRGDWVRLVLASVFLIGNYACASWGVGYIAPEAAMLVLQLAPLFLALGGWIFLHERVRGRQWICFAAIFLGLLLFLHKTLTGGFSFHAAGMIGVIIMLASAVSWSFFAMFQKILMVRMEASNILLAVYVVAAILLTPFSALADLTRLSSHQILWVFLACADTVLAYWSFSQALRYLQTVQVSSVIALAPVMAYAFTLLVTCLGWWPTVIQASEVDWLSLAGMGVVVLGAIGVQLVSAEPRQSIKEPASAAKVQLRASVPHGSH